MPKNLLESSMLMPKQAFITIKTNLFLVKGATILGLQFVIGNFGHQLVWKLVISMGKSTPFAVFAHTNINPVLTEFGLILTLLLVIVKLRDFLVVVILIVLLEVWVWVLGVETIWSELNRLEHSALNSRISILAHICLKRRDVPTIFCHI